MSKSSLRWWMQLLPWQFVSLFPSGYPHCLGCYCQRMWRRGGGGGVFLLPSREVFELGVTRALIRFTFCNCSLTPSFLQCWTTLWSLHVHGFPIYNGYIVSLVHCGLATRILHMHFSDSDNHWRCLVEEENNSFLDAVQQLAQVPRASC